jgi:predicted phosphodiesterase
MRIAVFSDVHGNAFACQAVLQAIQVESSCDALVAAGDLCLGGSNPAGCVDLLSSAAALGVYGNTEIYLFNPAQDPADEPHRAKWQHIQPAVYWTLQRLSAVHLEWLQKLPFELHFSPTSSQSDDLWVVHANPKDVERNIYPPYDEQRRLFDRLHQPDDDPALLELLDGMPAAVLAFGHFHYAFVRSWRDKTLVDVACCSLPGINHDRRAHYTLFTWREKSWLIEQRQVEYDAGQEIEALQASSNPSKEFFRRYFG